MTKQKKKIKIASKSIPWICLRIYYTFQHAYMYRVHDRFFRFIFHIIFVNNDAGPILHRKD